MNQDLAAELNHLCLGQAHQGSCYGAYKDVQMAYHRAEHVRSRIQELRNDQHLHQQQQQRLSQMASGDSLQRSFSLGEPQHSGQLGFTHTPEPMAHN